MDRELCGVGDEGRVIRRGVLHRHADASFERPEDRITVRVLREEEEAVVRDSQIGWVDKGFAVLVGDRLGQTAGCGPEHILALVLSYEVESVAQGVQVAWLIDRLIKADERCAGPGTVGDPQRSVRAVVGTEVQPLTGHEVHDGQLLRVGVAGGVEVSDLHRARDGAIADPQLASARPVIGDEDQVGAEGSQRLRPGSERLELCQS